MVGGEKKNGIFLPMLSLSVCVFSADLTSNSTSLSAEMGSLCFCCTVTRKQQEQTGSCILLLLYTVVYIYINGVIRRTGNILSHIFTFYFPLLLSIKTKCCTSSQTQIFANTVCPPVTFLTFLAEHEMHPHDTTGAKSHLYGASRKDNKEPTDQPCHSGVGENAEIFVMISSQIFKTEGEEITLHVRYVGRGE